MNEVFLVFLSLSLSGSLIALLLLLLKPIIKNHLSKTWQYYIFLIVIIRFLLPFGPDTSLMGMVFNQARDYVVAEDNPAANPNADNLLLLPEEVLPVRADRNANNPLSTPNDIGNLLIKWLWLAWLAPAVLLLFRKVVGYCRYTRSVKNGCSVIARSHTLDIYQKACEAMTVRHPPKLVQNKQVPAPMLVGIIWPVIVLPDIDMKDTDIQYIFQHELTHYKRLDFVYKWLVQIALCLHWFNPLVYWVSRETDRNCELSCDETVIKRLDEESKYAYGDMLLSAIRLDKIAPRAAVSITLSEDTKLMKERLEAIMTHKKQPRKIAVLSALLAIVLLCSAACSGVYVANPTSQNANTPGVQTNNTPNTQITTTTSETPVTIDEVEIQYYEDSDPDGRWPYLHWIISNNSNKTITDYEMACLVYDKAGNALELDWTRLGLTNGNQITDYTNQSDKAYEHMIPLADEPILPGEKENLNGGWSLYDGWNQASGTHNVAYVLACMKQITFEDGTVWENPEYQNWLSAYKGKDVEPKTLAAYYE